LAHLTIKTGWSRIRGAP